MCIVFCLFGALDLGLRSRLRHTSIPLGYWLRRYILTWPAGESIFFQLKFGIQCDKCESGDFSWEYSVVPPGVRYLTLDPVADLPDWHSISRHPHISFLFFPEVLRKWFYLQCQKQYMLSHSRSGRLENSASFELFIISNSGYELENFFLVFSYIYI